MLLTHPPGFLLNAEYLLDQFPDAYEVKSYLDILHLMVLVNLCTCTGQSLIDLIY